MEFSNSQAGKDLTEYDKIFKEVFTNSVIRDKIKTNFYLLDETADGITKRINNLEEV
jgi:vacuolar-type H+-ATPase subunit D/Vma8